MKSSRLWIALMSLLPAVFGPAGAAEGPPRRVLILGDSMMQIPAHSLGVALSKRPEVKIETFTRIGSGLARLDVFDWLERIRSLVEEFTPDTALVFMGANDHQAMKTGSKVIRPGDPAWASEYARRVGAAMDLLAGTGSAQVIWLELPDMSETRNREDADLMNRIFAGEAGKRKGVMFFHTRPILSRAAGKYSPYIIQANGMPLRVRSSDNIHLSREGADLLAARVIEFLWKEAPAP